MPTDQEEGWQASVDRLSELVGFNIIEDDDFQLVLAAFGQHCIQEVSMHVPTIDSLLIDVTDWLTS